MFSNIIAGHPLLRGPFIAVTIAMVVCVVAFVELVPAVDENFFFDREDPALKSDRKIVKIFPQRPQVIVSAAGDIHSSAYYRKIGSLTRDLDRVEGADKVYSMTSGPASVSEGFAGPFWSRCLVGEDKRSTLVIMFLSGWVMDGHDTRTRVISAIESVAAKHQDESFQVAISGVPYLVELIRRNLKEDLIVFSSAAVVIFGIMIFVMFRSVPVLAGTITACFFACAATLGILHLGGIRIGILSANLITLVFIMTLQHTVYIAHDLGLSPPGTPRRDAIRESIGVNWAASSWEMMTTMAGFLSLLLLDARPLKELGGSGAVGAVMALLSAYLVFPSFLHRGRIAPVVVSVKKNSAEPVFVDRVGGWLAKPHMILGAGLIGIALLASPGMNRVNTDPGLFTYFAENSEMRRGLEYIDSNGGSSPLYIVVRHSSGMRLDRKEAYPSLWSLQRSVEDHPTVGNVLSLPLIMAEAKRVPFAWLLNFRFLLEQMEKPMYDRVTTSFVTQDRTRALMYLRMKENVPRDHRLAEVEEIHARIRKAGFRPELSGGMYFLQGQLSHLIQGGLLSGMGQLLALFLIVSAFVARSVRWTLALGATLCIVPAIVLGIIGLSGIPVDIVSAPAVNLATSIGIGDMIHLTASARRLRRKGLSSRDSWALSVDRLWKPAAATAAIVCAGFSIFLLSNFPPTHRFGLAVIFGTVVAISGTLLVLPALASAVIRLRRSEGAHIPTMSAG
ncbi:MAG: MMPL family transporter [Candidatus Hydrogenedentota bacterium]